jgi:hypothetical protein
MRWPGVPRVVAWPLAAALGLLVTLGALALAGPSDAARPGAAQRDRLDRIVRFLQDTQNDDGGYGGSPGAASDPLFSAWVGIGLAAAGINPQDQKAPGARGRSVAEYVERHGPQRTAGGIVTTELERIGMFVNAAGMDPYRFGGRDYVASLLRRQAAATWTPGEADRAPDLPLPPAGAGGLPTDGASSGTRRVTPEPVPAGWFPHQAGGRTPGVNDTIFAIFFLAGVPGNRLRSPIRRAARAVEAMQRPDGTWPAVRPGDGTNVDMTGAAVQALCAARRCGTPAVAKAIAWLRERQQPDGGWQAGDLRDERPGESNAGTTPWVVQALWATGQDPARWRRPGGRNPLQSLASLQRREGSIRWRASRDLNPTWMTAYAAPAFAGQPWPVAAPPRASEVRRAEREARRERRAQERARRARRTSPVRGDAGEVRDGGGSVTGGGGGRGADLFSRPQPQSRGATTGGERDTKRDQDRRRGTKGRDGATGTAAASGPGDDGGVQNGERPGPQGTGGEVSGQVVQQPRGTEGTEQERAIAPGLRSADDGRTSDPLGLALLAGLLVAAAVGALLERRPLPDPVPPRSIP